MADIYTENMGRNVSESKRLDEQFELLTRNIGYILHPSIVSKLPSSPTIVDIGTGTGLFLAQLAKVYPNAELHGLDISSTLFPPAETLPPNVHLDTLDIKQPIPLAKQNKYDLVHVRLIAAGIAPSEWELVVQNIIQLLKPGGAVQWEECNWADVQHLRGGVQSSVYTAQLMGARFKIGLKDKFSYGWKTLPQIFENKGLVRIEKDIVSSDRVFDTRAALTRNGMQAIFSWSRLLSSRNSKGSFSVDELDRLDHVAIVPTQALCIAIYHNFIDFQAQNISPRPGRVCN
ncbi:hypothetical protein EYC80_009608 [Monilinia laxa]|uniref:Methyltransferase domain-containing protein n=1 Tax=Monilinia laxa TaxID=61186 RepID=A0A5N6JYF3_MONLA|nr:hypothetical protein EYC80_009608 [Monilinia laxa]